jgi:hypothetical protein
METTERRVAVQTLRNAGHSLRYIAAQMDVSLPTIGKDLAIVGTVPEWVIGLDGKRCRSRLALRTPIGRELRCEIRVVAPPGCRIVTVSGSKSRPSRHDRGGDGHGFLEGDLGGTRRGQPSAPQASR